MLAAADRSTISDRSLGLKLFRVVQSMLSYKLRHSIRQCRCLQMQKLLQAFLHELKLSDKLIPDLSERD